MFISRRRNILKRLEVERKQVQKSLKGYEKTLSKLQKERDRIAGLKSLSLSEKQMQYDFVDDKISRIKLSIDECSSLLNRLSEKYEDIGGCDEY